MKNIILGGGLVSFLARDILGDDWSILPVGKSRFYSYSPPLADDFVVADDAINEYMNKFTVLPIMRRYGYSYAGQILFNTAIALGPYLQKLHGNNVPPHAGAYWRNRIDTFTYGSCLDMHNRLQEKYKSDLVSMHKTHGVPVSINDHVIKTENSRIEYDKIVSTVPLPVLLKWLDVSWVTLPSRDVYYYHIRTNKLDFEGATRVFVVDPEIKFHSAYCINNLNYIFESCERIEQPGQYFMAYIDNFDLIAETSINQAVCCGPIPEIPEVVGASIKCVGQHAVWDDCLDIGSVIKRLIKIGA